MRYQKLSHCFEQETGVVLSAIIPCLNAADTIGVQLDALSKQKWDKPWEVIVADNGSSDDTVKIVEYYQDRFQRLRIVDASDKKGPSHARNVGADASNAELLAFL